MGHLCPRVAWLWSNPFAHDSITLQGQKLDTVQVSMGVGCYCGCSASVGPSGHAVLHPRRLWRLLLCSSLMLGSLEWPLLRGAACYSRSSSSWSPDPWACHSTAQLCSALLSPELTVAPHNVEASSRPVSGFYLTWLLWKQTFLPHLLPALPFSGWAKSCLIFPVS